MARSLKDEVDAEVREHDGETATLLEWLEHSDAAWLVDAASSGAEPGTIHRFDAGSGPLPSIPSRLSTHGVGLADSIELARTMGCLPGKCVVFAVEGASFETGRGLSGTVRSAAREVAARIRAELADRLEDEDRSGSA